MVFQIVTYLYLSNLIFRLYLARMEFLERWSEFGTFDLTSSCSLPGKSLSHGKAHVLQTVRFPWKDSEKVKSPKRCLRALDLKPR